MDIKDLIDEFVSRRRYKPYESICEDVLTSGKSYSLCSQEGCTESEYLQINIRSSVRSYTRNKDNAVELYRETLSYIEESAANGALAGAWGDDHTAAGMAILRRNGIM